MQKYLQNCCSKCRCHLTNFCKHFAICFVYFYFFFIKAIEKYKDYFVFYDCMQSNQSFLENLWKKRIPMQ